MKKRIVILIPMILVAFLVGIIGKNYFVSEKNKKQYADNTIKNTTKVEEGTAKVVVAATEDKSLAKNGDKTKDTPSRGGSINVEADKKVYNENTSKIEVVDWWKKGQHVFSNGTVAEVTDFYTKKKFKVKRTMGTNHADIEALTKEDSEIIKSIWNGFSWDRRPVVLNINNNMYAASMSAMPHAGLDSEPAYGVVNNRSGGYGRGQNLDVIKNNGMDGHMDIHFLNSTRHKDGKQDTQHQQEIAKMVKK